MYELTLTLQFTPYGVRISGPDPNRAVYLPVQKGLPGMPKPHPNGQAIWSSNEMDLFISPVADGVELKLKVHAPKKQVPQTTAKAA